MIKIHINVKRTETLKSGELEHEVSVAVQHNKKLVDSADVVVRHPGPDPDYGFILNAASTVINEPNPDKEPIAFVIS